MKKITFPVIWFAATIAANAQSHTFEWAKNMGGKKGNASGSSVALDASGNIYTSGYFTGSVDFDPGAAILLMNSPGGEDIVITKSDASGNLVWAKQLAGTLNERGMSVEVDGSGNVYTTGYFNGTVDFDPGAGTFNITSQGTDDIFISKLDAAGNFAWIKNFSGASFNGERGLAIEIDGSGNVYTTGYFYGTVDFDPGAGTFNLTSAGESDVFISKLDASGNFIWAKRMGGQVYDESFGISIDGSGNVYTTGSFIFTVDFDPGAGTFNLTSVATSTDIFISKLDASGNFVWAKQMGGTQEDKGNSITTDASGNVYTTGYFIGTADFDPGAGTFNLTSAGSYEFFLSKLDASGNVVWAKKIGSAAYDIGTAVTVDGLGNVYATDNFIGTADFDPGAGTFNLTSAGGVDIAIVKLDASGNFVWAKKMGGLISDFGNDIALDASGNILTTGSFYSTVDFDPGAGTFNLTSGGNYYSIFISKLNSSGNFVWAKSSGGSSSTWGESVAVDLSGNVYTAGYFLEISDFDPGAGTFYLTSSGDVDIFISKLDASGNFVWAKKIGGSTADYAYGIKADGSGNVYYTGLFQGTVDFDPGAGTSNLTSAGGTDLFISKLDASGNFVWAKKIGSSSYEAGKAIELDAAGNVYTTGHFSGTVDFNPGSGTFNLTAAGYGIFVLKLDVSGNFVWAKQMDGASGDFGNAIALDASGNVYTTGEFDGTADFDPGAGTFNLTPAGFSDIFISKLDASGNFVWAKQSGGAATAFEVGYSIAVDASGNVYTTGNFNGTSDFDPGAGIFNLTSNGGDDIFISKLDVSGNLVWAKRFGAAADDGGYAVKSDASGNVYTTGHFSLTVDFDPGAGTFNLTAASGSDVFVSKLDPSGNFIWAVKMGGASSDWGKLIALDASDNIFTTGSFSGTADFDPGAPAFNLNGADPDVFVHKMSQCALPPASITPSGTTTFCSGNSVVLNANTGTGITYQWKNNGTNISGETNSSYTAAASGSYTVVVTNTCGSATSSAVAVTVNPLPIASITPAGTTTFCSGGSVVLNANTGTGLTYQWKNNGTNISGATNSSYTANSSGSYTVVVTNSNNCSNTSSAVSVTVNPLPTVSFSGLAASYNVSAPAATLTGTPSGGTFSGPGISGNTFTPSVAGVGGPYTIVYSYTDGNGCSNSSSQQTTVTNCTVPAQPGTITVTGGIAKVCPGDSRNYSIAAVSGATSYTWTPPMGASITSGQGNTLITINYTAGFTASGTLSVIANNACGSGIAKTLTISRNNPSTPSVISGVSGGVCAGTSGAYSVTNVAGMTYNWTATANASIMSGQGTNSVTVSFSASWTSGSLSVTATNNCGTSGARTLSILSKPATPTTIIGASNTVCAGTTGAYHVTNVAGVTFNWTPPANASIISGQGTYSVSVSFSALFTSGSLTVSGTNGCGTSTLRTLSISSIPAKPGTITGPGFNNCNVTSTYTIAAVLYATSYTWSTNTAGALVTPNGTSASISFPTFTSGTISVTANNTCGNSAAKTLTVKGTPATPAAITGPAMVCASQFGVPYSIAAIPNATSYTWTGMTGSHISDGVVTSSGTTLTTTSTSVTVNFGSTSGILNVKANNACGAGSNKSLTIGFNCRENTPIADNDFDIKVFPNPSSGDFIFKTENENSEKISISIYDMTGKFIMSDNFYSPQFTIRNPQLSPGIYWTTITKGGGIKILKLVKTRESLQLKRFK